MEITKELLMYWSRYYSGVCWTFEDRKEFEKIIDKFGTQKVFDLLTWSYLCLVGQTTALWYHIRYRTVDLLLSALPDPQSLEPAVKATWNQFQESFLKELHEKIHTSM